MKNSPSLPREIDENPANVRVAMLGAPHGVRGEIRVKSYTQNGADFARLGPLRHEISGRLLVIERVRFVKDDMFVVKFIGVETRDDVQAMVGSELLVPRSALPSASEDEFYHADLIGLCAKTMDGAFFGTIKQVYNFGAGDILEIVPIGAGETIMLPFTKKVVPELDMVNRVAIIVLPEEIEADDAPFAAVKP